MAQAGGVACFLVIALQQPPILKLQRRHSAASGSAVDGFQISAFLPFLFLKEKSSTSQVVFIFGEEELDLAKRRA